MFVHNIQVFNNQNKPQYNIQPRKISFEANKLRLTKEIMLNAEQLEQVSFIADIYKKVTAFYSGLNGPYSYKFKDCFPNMLAGEKRKGFIFEGLLPKFDSRLQIAKLDPFSSDEIISLRITDKEYKDLLTCRINNDGKAHISADENYTPVWESNPFAQNAELNHDEFLSKLQVVFLNLRTYSDNFTKISRQLKSNMNEKTVREAISHIQTVNISKGLKSEMDSLMSNFAGLDDLLKTGRSTNAVMYKRMYFGEDYDCAKGILFRNVGPKGETYLYCPATSKNDDRVLRLVVSDAKGKIVNGFVFFADGKVMKQVSVEGIKAEDFRIQNLSVLSDTDIKDIKLRETMEIIDKNITDFRTFVAEKLQAKSDRKAQRQSDLAGVAQRREARAARKVEDERVAQQKAEARAIKQKEKEERTQQKELLREQRAEKRRQKELLREQRESRKISLEERREEKLRKQQAKEQARLAEQRKREEAREAAKREREFREKFLKITLTPSSGSSENHPQLTYKNIQKKNQTMNAVERFYRRRKAAEERRFSTIPTQIKQEIAESIKEVGVAPTYRTIPHTSCTKFIDCNLTKLVESIDTLFATPVEMRSPHLIHGKLPDGRIFGAKVSMIASDGANVTITRMKSPTYTDFSYYSISVEKDGQKYVVNLDPDFMRIIESVNGKPFVDSKNMIKHISKQELLETIPEAENLPRYFDEFFALKEDAERTVVISDLKLKQTKKLNKKQLIEQGEKEVHEALRGEDYSGFNYLLTDIS